MQLFSPKIRVIKLKVPENSGNRQSNRPTFIYFISALKDIDMDRIFGQSEILYHILYLKISKDIISYQISQFWILYPI